ncbi:VOC family protein [Tabrizicola fusiformis]|uniref:VOC family protein n=1 Tax=Tabrizicola sp. SY72 TaxID=2741673 RepID=UPI001573BE1F|nr:glyoxalase [Tabrizicola sp. SY72]NTT84546.1 glyoxalase [Tabrizicola sp. SY72]
MDYETVPARDFGHALRGLSVNLLVRDVPTEATFLVEVFGMQAHRMSADFAILTHAGQPFQLHSDASFGRHPLSALLPEAGPRGAGIELRLHEADPDQAAARAQAFESGMVLQAPVDKAGHGLREAVILSPSGYAWVPSRRI